MRAIKLSDAIYKGAIGLLSLCFLVMPATTTANSKADFRPDFGLSSVYDPTYAMDFKECPNHFVDGMPPMPVTQDKIYLDTQASRTHDGQSVSLCFKGFATYYSFASNTAIYSANYLTNRAVQHAKKLPRKDSFRPEVRLAPTKQIVPATYKRSGYDKGHLVPNGDMADVQTQYDSFSMVNIIPQNSEHNRNLWRQIETDVRMLAQRYNEVYVITGTAYHGKYVQSLDNILVPTHLYKAVYVPSINVAGVYYSPNDASMVYDVIDVGTFTSWTGLMPFPSVKPNFNQSVFEGSLGAASNHATYNDAEGVRSWRLLRSLIQKLWHVFGQNQQ